MFSTACGVPSMSFSRTSVQPQCHPGECHHLTPIHIIQKPGTSAMEWTGLMCGPPLPPTRQSCPFHLPNTFCIHLLFFLSALVILALTISVLSRQVPSPFTLYTVVRGALLKPRCRCIACLLKPFCADPHALRLKTSLHLVAHKAPACLQLVNFLLLSTPPTTNPQLPTLSPHSADRLHTQPAALRP